MTIKQDTKHAKAPNQPCCDRSCRYSVSGSTALSVDLETDRADSLGFVSGELVSDHSLPENRTSKGSGILPGISLDFRELTIDDRPLVSSLLAAEDSLASDGCFGTLFLWGRSYGMTAAPMGERMICRYDSGDGLFFSYPFGSGPLKPAVLQMKQLAENQRRPLILRGMTGEQKQRLETELPDLFSFEEIRSSADYIYEADVLANLGGKKLHNKRNHCNRFEQECPDWKFEPLQKQHIPSCIRLLERWESEHEDLDAGMPEAEKEAIMTAFCHYDTLGLQGGVLYAGERLVAFTFGEPVGKNGFDVRFEKADTSVHGTYQMINREFVRHLLRIHPGLLYINREEDMGMENLRKAKESYYPAFLLNKYAARW